MSPTTTPKLVQKSDITWRPSAMSTERIASRRPVVMRNQPSAALTSPANNVSAAPNSTSFTEGPRIRSTIAYQMIAIRGEGDEPALEDGAEVLDLAVTIRMVAVGRPPANTKLASAKQAATTLMMDSSASERIAAEPVSS